MNNRKQKKLGQRGQVMVLGVVTLVVLAFMTMLSFNVGNAVNQKIRLQAHSDAMAYSMAVTEARAFNFYAYSNRAIAAVLVAQATLHSYHAIVTEAGPIMTAGMYTFFIIAGIEFALCCACPWCACVWHCIDAVQAILVALKYMKEIKTWNNKVRQMEGKFNNAVRLLGVANDEIHNSQLVMGADMVAKFLTGGAGAFGNIKDKNDKCAADTPLAVTTMSVYKMACALEGAATDSICGSMNPLPLPDKVARTGKVQRRKVLTNAANASLPEFDRDRAGVPGMALVGLSVINKAQSIPNGGQNRPAINIGGGGRITNGDQLGQCKSNSNNNEGSTACGWDFGSFGSIGWKHGVGAMVYGGFVASNRNGGKHTAGDADMFQFINKNGWHSGTHDRFRATQWGQSDDPFDGTDCLLPTNQHNCFINFRAPPGGQSSQPYNQQPVVYASTKKSLQTLRDNDCGSKKQPWEMTNSGSIEMDDGARGKATLTFVPKDDAYAISKAMVYFHRFDSWKAAPNMFDPYWRAKLHPIDGKAEAAALMTAAGDTSNLPAAAGGPVEGKFP